MITIQYKTPKGTVWPTILQAELADVLEDSSMYFEEYKLRNIVDLIAKYIDPEGEFQDETD